MKKKWLVFSLAMTFAAGCAAESPAQSSNTAATTTMAAEAVRVSTQDEDRNAMNATVPVNFSEYASAAAERNTRCVVGASVDDDGLNQRPVLILSEQGDRVRWAETLPLPPDTYQSRATHCFEASGSLYVLIQSDTQPEQTLSQTLLRVLSISPRNGAVIASADIEPAGITDAHSAWVEEGQQNFRLQNGKVVVTGMYYRLAAPEDRKPFAVELSSTLKQ